MLKFLLRTLYTQAIATLWVAIAFAQAAPEFELPILDKTSALRLSDLRGKVVYVDFWASWCAPCALSMPELESIRSRLHPRGFEVLAINLDSSLEDARRFLARTKVSYPILLDRKQTTPELFGVQGMPTAFLIDREGRLRNTHKGFKKGDADKLTKLIEQLLLEDSAL